jgi:hypothetical protein
MIFCVYNTAQLLIVGIHISQFSSSWFDFFTTDMVFFSRAQNQDNTPDTIQGQGRNLAYDAFSETQSESQVCLSICDFNVQNT